MAAEVGSRRSISSEQPAAEAKNVEVPTAKFEN